MTDLPRRHSSGSDAGSDDGLGAALARAIDEHVGAVDPQPQSDLSDLVERAEARARVQASRRAAASLVAAAVVLIGGVVVWNALDPLDDPDRTVVTSGDTASQPDPAAGETAAGDPGGSGRGQPEAAGSARPSKPDQSSSPSGSNEVAAAAAQPAASPSRVTSAALSTGPVLQWSEISMPFPDATLLDSTSDGRVVALARDGERGRVLVTSDGVNWAEVPLPEGIDVHQIDISGGRWLATGTGPADAEGGSGLSGPGWQDPFSEEPTRVFYSDDQGTAWTELALELLAGPAPPYVITQPWVTNALTSGQNMVLVMLNTERLDVPALLTDKGLVPEGQRVISWNTHTDYRGGALADGTLQFTLADADDYLGQMLWGVSVGSSGTASSSGSAEPAGSTEPAVSAESTGSAESAGSAVAYVEAFGAADATSAEVSFDELGLTSDQRSILIGDSLTAEGLIYWSDGGPFELVLKAEYEYWGTHGTATTDGFVLLGYADDPPSGSRLALLSPDGRTWSEQTLEGDGYMLGQAVVGADGRTIWSGYQHYGVQASLQRFRYGEDPVTVATFDERLELAGISAGPAGLALTAHVWADDGSVASAVSVPEGRVAKDGYELRYGEPDGGITLWDLTADAAVYVFGPEAVAESAASDTPPEGVREVGDGQQFAFVFLDPDTGEDLVTFTMDDVATVFDAQLAAVESVDYQHPESWVGWSADGGEWGWQQASEAFGVDSDHMWVQLAVGGDFVLALVEAIEPVFSAASADSEDGNQASRELPAARWFIARVP